MAIKGRSRRNSRSRSRSRSQSRNRSRSRRRRGIRKAGTGTRRQRSQRSHRSRLSSGRKNNWYKYGLYGAGSLAGTAAAVYAGKRLLRGRKNSNGEETLVPTLPPSVPDGGKVPDGGQVPDGGKVPDGGRIPDGGSIPDGIWRLPDKPADFRPDPLNVIDPRDLRPGQRYIFVKRLKDHIKGIAYATYLKADKTSYEVEDCHHYVFDSTKDDTVYYIYATRNYLTPPFDKNGDGNPRITVHPLPEPQLQQVSYSVRDKRADESKRVATVSDLVKGQRYYIEMRYGDGANTPIDRKGEGQFDRVKGSSSFPVVYFTECDLQRNSGFEFTPDHRNELECYWSDTRVYRLT